MRKKTYNYEKFTTCTELLSEFKNAKKSKNNFGNIFKKIIENRQIEFKTWPLKALNLLIHNFESV